MCTVCFLLFFSFFLFSSLHSFRYRIYNRRSHPSFRPPNVSAFCHFVLSSHPITLYNPSLFSRRRRIAPSSVCLISYRYPRLSVWFCPAPTLCDRVMHIALPCWFPFSCLQTTVSSSQLFPLIHRSCWQASLEDTSCANLVRAWFTIFEDADGFIETVLASTAQIALCLLR